VRSLPAAELNAAGQSFCAAVNPVLRRFPFNPQGQDAAVDDVSTVFQRDGIVNALLQDRLQPLMTAQGRARPGQNVRPDFARFMTRAVEFSTALYGGGGGPELAFDFQPEIPAGASEVIFELDGREVSWSPASAASRQFLWSAERSTGARLIVVMDGQRVTVATGDGPWSVFRLFRSGAWSGSGRHRIEWRVPGRNTSVVAHISFEAGIPAVLAPGYLAPLSQCVSRISN
jgi:type VI protein secretion system component VasK